MKKIALILDGDPGHDDAIAWVLAKSNPLFDILAVTSVAGNQTLKKTTYNTQRICTLLGIQAPIAKGREVPLMADLITASNFHGESGLDGPALPEPSMELSPLSSVSLMAKVLKESKEKVTIVATGPLTNVAELLLVHPELKEKIERISIMGGGLRNGNWTSAAEFNIYEDPEAADVVFKAGIPLIMCGLDVTEKAIVYPEDAQKIREVGNQVASIVADWLAFFFKHHKELGWNGSPLHDPCAIAVLMKPEIFEIRNAYVQIDTKGQYTRGATIGDLDGKLSGKACNVQAVIGVDRHAFVELLVESCQAYQGHEVKI
ncbi:MULTISPECIES: nucleoside hydrolase [Terrabacteria group]|uniref:nucleoside hydrolase n=1 Tax=Bacillati TaxID=1783272 RepID=UPI001939F9FC|nr:MULTISPECIES: nucleoside hydrolase [Terrabacteria group]MBW9212211.1 nucleoside hydrolase [Trueperella sp. zg.1013]QRG86244.1 nucleoside hydrolase [Bulleidia sp. zg-1006]